MYWIKCHWESLSLAWKIAIGVLTAISAYAVAQGYVLKAWRWMLAKRDAPIRKLFDDWDESSRLTSQGSYSLSPEFKESDIATQTGRRSVSKSLARLAATGRIRRTRSGGWESSKNGETHNQMGREWKRGR